MHSLPPRIKYNAGMTLIELLVVLGIFVIVTSLVIFDYGSYQSNVSLQNLSSDVALSIRKAQSYAIGAYGSGSTFTYPYGIHFSTAKIPVAYPHYGSNKAFLLFTDVSGNRIFNSDGSACGPSVTASNECSEMLTIASGDEVSALYLNGSTTAVPEGGNIDIVFARPNPDAYFCYRSSATSSVCDAPTTISSVKIEISNLNKAIQGTGKKYITVWSTGQISTQ